MLTIQPMLPEEIDEVATLARAVGVFAERDVEILVDILDFYFSEESPEGHVALVARNLETNDDKILGFAYHAPAAMTDRTRHLWWIFTDPRVQGKGVARSLLEACEVQAILSGCRILLVETSSLEAFARARAFYQKCGYFLSSSIRDYYADGDDMVIFCKRFIPSTKASFKGDKP